MSENDLTTQLKNAIHQARARVYRVGQPTPLQRLPLEALPDQVWVKREDLGPVKAYKWRGAYNAMAALSEKQRASGVVAASAGNHAQGIAIGARTLSCRARIFMPEPTPAVKRKAVEAHGGDQVTIELIGDSFSEAQEAALRWAEAHQATLIPPYDSLTVMGGQGTLADEIVMSSHVPFDRVYVAIGGGGLASATATWLKSYWPEVKVIGVEGNDQASMSAAMAAGAPVKLDYVDLFCDGTAVTQVGDLTYQICRDQLDDIIKVSNQEVVSAIRAHWEGLRVIPEPSGAMSLAGYMQEQAAGKVDPKERVLTILCGANMDFAKVAEISRQAGITPQKNRSWRFAIPGERGSLVKLLTALPQGVSIIDLQYGQLKEDPQRPILTLQISQTQELEFSKWLAEWKGDSEEVSECVESSYRVIPFSPALFRAPLFVEVEFPERAGALLGFMKKVSPLASLCYFNYQYSGERVGRALLGLDFDDRDALASGRHAVLALSGQIVRAVREVEIFSKA